MRSWTINYSVFIYRFRQIISERYCWRCYFRCNNFVNIFTFNNDCCLLIISRHLISFDYSVGLVLVINKNYFCTIMFWLFFIIENLLLVRLSFENTIEKSRPLTKATSQIFILLAFFLGKFSLNVDNVFSNVKGWLMWFVIRGDGKTCIGWNFVLVVFGAIDASWNVAAFIYNWNSIILTL